MTRLFETGYLSDVTLNIGKEVIKAHKSVLSSKSTWFKRKFEVDLIVSHVNIIASQILKRYRTRKLRQNFWSLVQIL
jgi:hypothetical protein